MPPLPDDDKPSPVALRLVPSVSGLSVRKLAEIILDPVTEGPAGVFGPRCPVFQWHAPGDYSEKPIPALRFALADAISTTEKRASIAAVPSDLFVWFDVLERAIWEHGYDSCGEPPPYDERPDRRPNISGIEDLIRECPEELRGIVQLPNERVRQRREAGKAKTDARNAELQRRFNERLAANPGLKKAQICTRLAQDKQFDGMTAATIERIVKMK